VRELLESERRSRRERRRRRLLDEGLLLVLPYASPVVVEAVAAASGPLRGARREDGVDVDVAAEVDVSREFGGRGGATLGFVSIAAAEDGAGGAWVVDEVAGSPADVALAESTVP
jgi:hypothetical protein